MKTIPKSNYIISPFITHKAWQFNYTYLGTNNPSQISIDLASSLTNLNSFTSSSQEWANPDGLFTRTLYPSAQHIFYNSSSAASLPLGIKSKLFFPTGSQFYVLNVSQRTYGEGIQAGTFVLTSGQSTASISDDGNGHLYASTNANKIVGNIIYESGVVILQQDTGSYSGSLVTDNGLFLTTGSVVDINYSGIHTIYEHRILCTMEPGEMNFSTNPTMADATLSGSLSGSVFTQSSSAGPLAIDLLSSGTLEPYFTQIGLYDDQHQLMAVAKFAQPLRRSLNSQQTIVVTFDL